VKARSLEPRLKGPDLSHAGRAAVELSLSEEEEREVVLDRLHLVLVAGSSSSPCAAIALPLRLAPMWPLVSSAMAKSASASSGLASNALRRSAS